MPSQLDQLCKSLRLTATVTYGLPPSEQSKAHDEWKRKSNPWTVVLKFQGRRMTVPFWTGSALTSEPTAADVLHCLLCDASSVEGSTFHAWCDDLGYSSDSIQARDTFLACERLAAKVHKLLGDSFDTFRGAEH